jgi:hypothetical protein
VNVGIPFVEASWGIPSPRSGGPAARANENARGLGDVTTLARVALFGPSPHRTWNVLFGGGLKLPTGANAATDVFPDGNGNNNLERYVDISVHPGDGGWGVLFDLQSYKAVRRFMMFGSASWLANPRNTGTPSRGNVVTSTSPTNVNTVSDQFIFRAGATTSVSRHIAASIAWRMEGVPRYDLFGRSDGFRGVTVSAGGHAVSFNLPIGYYFNRFRNPYTGNTGDSTFPQVVAIATYSMRVGRTPMRDRGVTDQPANGSHPLQPGRPDDDQD